jgi:hypothetical protein
MARLPSDKYLIQMLADNTVSVSENYSEREIARFNPADRTSLMVGLDTIQNSDLSEDDKYAAHFWVGYFYANAVHGDR